MRNLTTAVLALALTTCRVTFPEDLPYACTTDADCGGAGWVCTTGAASKHCCQPSGEEICGDGIDNDCDGTIDVTSTVELCNGKDDNCDGHVDEGFNLTLDPKNCGMCGKTCAENELCMSSVCGVRRERICDDVVDNDMNGLTDCKDPQCEGLFCGMGCACHALVKAEATCSDAMDNDGDSMIDCADSDCATRPCGTGCECKSGGGKKEVACNDALDNDGDGMSDCADSDCRNQFCTPAPLYFTCTNSGQCRCNGGAQISEAGSTCRDGIDNDCNGKVDCAESTCAGQTCTFDGGTGTCSALSCQ